jgi:hypothetical protein
VDSGRPAAADELFGMGGGGGRCLSGEGVSSFRTLFEGLLDTDCGLRMSTGDVEKMAEYVGLSGLSGLRGIIFRIGFGATGIGSIVAGLSNFGVFPSSSKTVAVLKTLAALGDLYGGCGGVWPAFSGSNWETVRRLS